MAQPRRLESFSQPMIKRRGPLEQLTQPYPSPKEGRWPNGWIVQGRKVLGYSETTFVSMTKHCMLELMLLRSAISIVLRIVFPIRIAGRG
jgi:hypothetical protein